MHVNFKLFQSNCNISQSLYMCRKCTCFKKMSECGEPLLGLRADHAQCDHIREDDVPHDCAPHHARSGILRKCLKNKDQLEYGL